MPIGPGTFDGIDRVLAIETLWDIDPRWTVRAGGLHDRVTITKTGLTPETSENTRVESRAFVGLRATFGRVHMEGIEGIELDPEPYEQLGAWLRDAGLEPIGDTARGESASPISADPEVRRAGLRENVQALDHKEKGEALAREAEQLVKKAGELADRTTSIVERALSG